MAGKKDKVLILLTALGMAGFFLLPLVEVKPNRIVSGEKLLALEYLGAFGALIIVGWAIFMALSLYGIKRKNELISMVGIVMAAGIIFLIPTGARDILEVGANPRVSFSSGLYIQILSLYIILSTYLPRAGWSRRLKAAMGIGAILIMGSLVSIGYFDDLSLIKEYGVRKGQFYNNLYIHGVLTFGSVLAGALMAIPLGYLAYSRKKLEGRIMVPLSIIETIPSLSLFGILLVPLSGLGQLPFFRAIGVSGIGWAPAFVALTLYTLLPIGRNTLTGFHSIDKNVVEAARGMGMSRWQILKKIEIPLAFPVIFTGIRIAFIQTIGGAVLAGLVGGGGMGSFVFLGLAEASPDLILLGVIPIVFFTVVLDYSLKEFEKYVRRVVYD
ncbi:ABC transporter permease [Gudongella sp. SC589]|jgi:osmoprotectant transport system permease protein|uniref:ABC transporter permease n=1 Tax=Gudongella sp. SC589 TaxID=3385990 RepID=UPI003904D5F5